MSMEAAFLFPTVIFIYYLTIMSSLLLLTRCLMSQNNYVICARTASFSMGGEDYGEIVYCRESTFNKEEYALKRLETAAKMYIAFHPDEGRCIVSGSGVTVETKGKSKIGRYDCIKECVTVNPVNKVRELRY